MAGGPNSGVLPTSINTGTFDERAFENAGGSDTPMPHQQEKIRISPAQVVE
jgi:hypothetical protein